MSSSTANIQSDDYYKVIGIPKSATEKEITKAYRKLAMKWHPDRHPTPAAKKKAEANFKRIGEAYQTLSDPKQRETYDRFGKAGLKGGMPPGGGAGGAGFRRAGGGGGAQFSYADAEDIFKNLFGGGGGGFTNFGGGNTFVFTSGGGGGGGGNPFGGQRSSMGGFGGGSSAGGFGGMGSQFGGAGGGGFPGGFTSRGTTRPRPRDMNQGMGRPSKRPRVETPLKMKSEVTVHGLVKSPDLNGKPGVIVDYDPTTQRYVVKVGNASGMQTVKVKAVNLVQRVRGEVQNLNTAKYNGTGASVVGKRADGRYICSLDGGKLLALQPEKVKFSSGTRVRIEGLSGAKQWNSHWAVINEYLPAKSRYRVRLLQRSEGGKLTDGKQQYLDLKPENFVV